MAEVQTWQQRRLWIFPLFQLLPFGFWMMKRSRESQGKEDVAQVVVGAVRGLKTALNYKPARKCYYFGNHYVCSYSHLLNISLDYIERLTFSRILLSNGKQFFLSGKYFTTTFKGTITPAP